MHNTYFISRLILSAIVIVAGVLKLTLPLGESAFLGAGFELIVSLVEIVLGLCLLIDCCPVACAMAICGLAGSGVTLAWFAKQPCGCFGKVIVLSLREHSWLAVICAILSWVIVIVHSNINRHIPPMDSV